MKNIYLCYVLTFLKNSWFFLGVWVLYYLRFTDYKGIGLAEAVMIITATIAEIPTGAIADIFGKKKTLILSFSLITIGNLLMAVTPNYNMLLTSIIIMTVGGAFYSGTLDAIAYDSLKANNNENQYPKVISLISTIGLISFCVTGLLGGLMYASNPHLPFFACGIATIGALIVSCFLREPVIDSDTFSIVNYVNQTMKGFEQLFSKTNKWLVIKFLSISMFVVIGFEMLNDIILVDLGFTSKQLGLIVSIMSLVAAAVTYLSSKKLSQKNGDIFLFIGGSLIAITYLVSPWAPFYIGALVVTARASLGHIVENIINIEINSLTQSKYRATTLSTYSLLSNLFYVCLATTIGSLADKWGSPILAQRLGVVMLVLMIITITITALASKRRLATNDSE